MNKTQNRKTHLLPFPVIVAATSGDVDAINQVLKHYEGYIMALSKRRLYSEKGYPHFYVDKELRLTLETTLISKNLTFDVA